MNPRQETLQLLFSCKIFDGNNSELARTLGYKNSRTTIERIKKGEKAVGAKKLDALYEKIREEYLITDNEIETVARSVAFAKEIYSSMRDLYGTNDEWHNRIFGILVTENYSQCPEIGEEVIKELKEMKLQEPEVYFAVLAYFFILCKSINPYTKKGRKPLAAQMNGLNNLLYELYPENNRSYESATELIQIDLENDCHTIIKLIYSFRHIIRGYVDNDYFENFLREMGILLDVGEDSFWTVPGETFHEGCELWYFSVIPTKSLRRGAYMAMKLKALTSATDSFELVAAYNIMFTINENYDNVQLFYAYEISTGKIECTIFLYDDESRLLTLYFEDAQSNSFNLPELLICINHNNPKSVDEKVWSKIIEKLLDKKCPKFILTATNSSSGSNLEYLGEYDVTNVCIDRENLTVTIEKEIGREYDEEKKKDIIVVEQKSYTISIDSHTFLEKLTPMEFASVARYKDTGELAIAWNFLGQNIPLRKFVENISDD